MMIHYLIAPHETFNMTAEEAAIADEMAAAARQRHRADHGAACRCRHDFDCHVEVAVVAHLDVDGIPVGIEERRRPVVAGQFTEPTEQEETHD